MALARVAAATGREVGELKVMTFHELTIGKPPVLVGGGRVDACTGSSTSGAAVYDALQRAQRALDYMEPDKARAHLQLGSVAVGCLAEPVNAEQAARLHFLTGYTALGSGDALFARESFTRALMLQPGLAWDANLPPDGKEQYDVIAAEIAASAPMAVQMVPAPLAGSLWVDGVASLPEAGVLSLRPGTHLLQVVAAQRTHTMWVRVQPAAGGESARLVVPGIVPVEAAGWVVDPALRPLLDTLLASVLDPGARVYFSAAGEVWEHTVGSAEWPSHRVPASFPGALSGRVVAGRSLAWGGAAVALAGGAVTSVSLFAGLAAERAGADATDWSAYEESRGQHETADDQLEISRWVAVGGAVLAGAGVSLMFLDGGGIPWSFAPMWAGAPGLQLMVGAR